jgi:hypothetical protein
LPSLIHTAGVCEKLPGGELFFGWGCFAHEVQEGYGGGGGQGELRELNRWRSRRGDAIRKRGTLCGFQGDRVRACSVSKGSSFADAAGSDKRPLDQALAINAGLTVFRIYRLRGGNQGSSAGSVQQNRLKPMPGPNPPGDDVQTNRRSCSPITWRLKYELPGRRSICPRRPGQSLPCR